MMTSSDSFVRSCPTESHRKQLNRDSKCSFFFSKNTIAVLRLKDEIDVDVRTLGGREFHSEIVLGRKELKKS